MMSKKYDNPRIDFIEIKIDDVVTASQLPGFAGLGIDTSLTGRNQQPGDTKKIARANKNELFNF